MKKPSAIIFDLGNTVMEEISFDDLAGNKRLLEFAATKSGATIEEVQRVADEVGKDVDRFRLESGCEFSFRTFNRLLFGTLGISFKIDLPRTREGVLERFGRSQAG